MKTKKGATEVLTLIPSNIVGNIGRAVFGTHWQAPLAKALKVQDQTMRRWTNDGCPVTAVATLRTILKEREIEIGKALVSLAQFDEPAQ